jgi:YtkA-like
MLDALVRSKGTRSIQWQLDSHCLIRFLFIATALLLLSGCRAATGSGEQVTIEPRVTPEPARVGPATIEFKLKDGEHRPVTGANAVVEGNMTHPGMAPVFADAKEIAPGTYSCRIDLSMAGDWIIVVHLTLSDGNKLERTFAIRGVRSD